MEQIDRFHAFRDMSVEILSHSGNCAESQAAFKTSRGMQELVRAWRTFWHGMLTEVPDFVTAAFHAHYDEYRTDLNAAGIYFNESASDGVILIHNATVPSTSPEGAWISVRGTAKAYVIGSGRVQTTERAEVFCNNADAEIILAGDSRGNIQAARSLVATTRANLTCSCSAECFGLATVYISHGTLIDNGHRRIVASGDAEVLTRNQHNIETYGNAKTV